VAEEGFDQVSWDALTASNLTFVPVEKQLTPHELFRLVEIAHDTKDYEIRKAALRLLDRHLNPLLIVREASE
jgi:hypothetical protein